VTCISTKIEDGGHFIPFDQNICRSKQDMEKNDKRVLHIVLKVFSNEKRKNILSFPFRESTFIMPRVEMKMFSGIKGGL
jgi:hypothetical protein